MLAAIEAVSGRLQSLPSHNAARLLGWRSDPEALLVSRTRGSSDDAGTLSAAGAFQPFRAESQDADDEDRGAILAYAQASDRLVVALPSEDQGDPVALRLVGPGAAPAESWLANFPRLTDLALSPDGKWATFVDRGRFGATGDPGGDVYVVEVGSNDARLLRKGIPGEVSYSSPVARP
jgi:hypothetical protein